MIRHQIDMAMILVDTVTGRRVDKADILFYNDLPTGKKQIFPVNKGNGVHVFMNMEKENFWLEFSVKGYEPVRIYVDFGELLTGLPIKEVFMMPSERSDYRDMLLSVSGKLPGLITVSGMNLSEVRAHAVRFEERHCLLRVFEEGFRLNQEGSPYGVVNQEEESYQIFSIKTVLPSREIILRAPLEEEVVRNSPIARLSYGLVKEDGSFVFKVLNEIKDLNYLLRFDFEDKVLYKKIDFKKQEEIKWEW